MIAQPMLATIRLVPETTPDLQLPILALALVALVAGLVLVLARRYKRCPSNKILIVYGKTSAGRAARALHGGGAFVVPLIQSYDFLSLDPMQIEIPLQGALSIENIRVSVPSVFTVAIGTDAETMNNAAVRLLGLEPRDIVKQAEDIIFGQLRQVIASMRIEQINRDRDVFLEKVLTSLEPELKKIGLVLINVNIKDITDESGYIEAIGRKAAAEAIKQAEIDVALQERKGAIGVAQADKDKSIGVAEAEKEKTILVANAQRDRDIGTTEAQRDRAIKLADLEREKQVGERTAAFSQEAQVREAERQMRIAVADANAKAVTGENTAKAAIAQSNGELRIREAEAYQAAESRHREAEAAVREAQFRAEARAALAQADKIEAEKRAELEASAKAAKAQIIVDAEAEGAKRRIEAEGEAAAIYAKLAAEAKGQFEMLARKADGLRAIVDACGGAQPAFQMLMLEHVEKLAETAASAISRIRFDKVVVWDGGGNGATGGGTAGFLRSLAGALPPALQLMKDIGGVEMPEYFAKLVDERVKRAGTEGATTDGGPTETAPHVEPPPAAGKKGAK